MTKEYVVKYWTKENRIVSVRISAQSGLDAKMEVETYPNFGMLCNYPQEV